MASGSLFDLDWHLSCCKVNVIFACLTECVSLRQHIFLFWTVCGRMFFLNYSEKTSTESLEAALAMCRVSSSMTTWVLLLPALSEGNGHANVSKDMCEAVLGC